MKECVEGYAVEARNIGHALMFPAQATFHILN
jgi:hypothetical protein